LNVSREAIPLCVDLDGTLTLVDTLHESVLGLAKNSPLSLFMLPIWLLHGKAYMKRQIAFRAKFEVSRLPFRSSLLDWLKLERAGGRRLVLVTAADSHVANDVAAHLDVFHETLASDGLENLGGERKRRALVERFGERGFDYVGNSRVDERVWRSAHSAIVVGSARQAERAGRLTEVERTFPQSRGSARQWLRAVRVHQWAKNTLIFLPPVLAHQIFQAPVFLVSLLAFFSFSLCASSIYLINDLLDLSADRAHRRKRDRPFAAGQLSALSGVAVSITLLVAALALGLVVGFRFAAVLGAYYVLTWAYSLRLKSAPLVDVMTLAGLYSIRIIAGSAATSIPPSFWLLAFSVFIFLSLGIVKRYTEISDSGQLGNGRIHGRGYSAADLPLLLNLGVASGYCTVVVMALYVNSADSQRLYRHSEPLWLICPLLLYWVSRVWLLTTRGQMQDDPVVFALRDRISLTVLALLGAIIFLSI
jgi:4-hydroxybenzoate polyprenyltransferase